MKTLYHSTAIVFFALMAAHDSHGQAMLLASTNGSTASYALNSIQHVVFRNNTLLVNDGICETHHFSIFYTDYITLDGTVAVVDANSNHSLYVYPNPAQKVVRVNLEGVALADVVVYNVLGCRVFAQSNCAFPYALDIQDFPSGLYTIATHSKTIQFVKQ